jgi:hypothetical protein
MNAFAVNGIGAGRGFAAAGDQKSEGKAGFGEADAFGALLDQSGANRPSPAKAAAPSESAPESQGAGAGQCLATADDLPARLLALSGRVGAECGTVRGEAPLLARARAAPEIPASSPAGDMGTSKCSVERQRDSALATPITVAADDKAPVRDQTHKPPADDESANAFAPPPASGLFADPAAAGLASLFAGPCLTPASEPGPRLTARSPEGRTGQRPASAVDAPRSRLASAAVTAPEAIDAPVRVAVTGQRSWFEPVRASAVSLSAPDAGRVSEAESESGAESEPAAPPSASEATPQPGLFTYDGPPVATPRGSQPGAASAAAPSVELAAAPRTSGPRRDLDVTLEPEHLGGLAVRLKSIGDRLDISIVADKTDTARLIGDHSLNLESQLHNAGLGAGGLSISVEARADGGPGGEAQGQGPGQGQDHASRHGADADAQGGWREEGGAGPRRQGTSSQKEEQGHGGLGDGRLGAADRGAGDGGLYL